jgi:TatD DNase family protein
VTAARDGRARAARDGTPGRPGEVPAPEPLPADALDSHCHLDLIDRPAGEVIAAAQAVGIRRMITVGVDLPSSRWSAECAAGFGDVYAAVAVHPNETAAAASSPAGQAAVLAEIAELAALPQVRAIGETGLDYYRDHASPEIQRDWFRAHIAMAKQAGKALMIHDREAHDDVLRILDEEGPPDKVIFHCFSGDAAMAKRCAEAGYVMSFAGNLTFKNAQPLRDAAAAAPAELLLVETDAPFLTPVPHRGKPNSPAMAADTLRCLAGVKQIDIARLCALITATGERAFGPW